MREPHGEAIFDLEGKPMGRVTSGTYGDPVGTSLAMGSHTVDEIPPDTEFAIAILGLPHRARLLGEPLFDPQGERLRQ